VSRQRRRHASGPHTRQFLRLDHKMENVGSRGKTAKLFRKPQPGQSEPGDFAMYRARDFAGLVPLIYMRHQPVVDKTPQRVSPLPVLISVERRIQAYFELAFH